MLKPTSSLRKNFSWTLAGSLVYTVCQWGQLVVLAKLGSPEVVGQHTFALAVTAPVFLFFGMDMRAVQATDSRHEHTFQVCLGMRIITTTAAWTLIALGVVVSGYVHASTGGVILLVALAKSFESISDTCFGALQRHERMNYVGCSQMIQGTLTLLAMGYTMYWTRNLLWTVTAMVVVWAGQLFFYDLPNIRRVLIAAQRCQAGTPLRPHWSLAAFRQLGHTSLPLGFVRLLTSLDQMVPRYFLLLWYGEAQVGIYSAMAYMMIAGNRFMLALSESLIPRVANHFRTRDFVWLKQAFLGSIGFALLLGIATMGVSAIWGQAFLSLVYRPEYSQYPETFMFLMAATSVGYVAVCLRAFINASRSFRLQLILSLISSAGLQLACLVMIRKHGPLGAGIAGLIGTSVAVVVGVCLVRVVWSNARANSESTRETMSPSTPAS